MKRTYIFLTVVLALAVVAGGVFWFRRERGAKIPVAEPNQNDHVSSKTFKPVAGENDKVWFPVPELGIEIKVNKNIAPELVYKTSKADWAPEYAKYDIMSAQFSTKKLNDIATKNWSSAYENDGSYACSMGTFTRYSVARKDLEKLSDYGYIQPSVADVDGYFVFYGSPQASCTYGPDDKGYSTSDREYEQYVVSNWWKPNFENLKESLQQSVRRIK